jgi:hypothetical protein
MVRGGPGRDKATRAQPGRYNAGMGASAVPAMGVDAFLARVRSLAEPGLEASGYAPSWRRRFGLLQASFGRAGLHYEVWPQRPRRQVELGLHLEADAERNAALLAALAPEMPAIWAETGLALELEQWTATWGRVHVYVPFDRLDEELAGALASGLVACVLACEPRLGRRR